VTERFLDALEPARKEGDVRWLGHFGCVRRVGHVWSSLENRDRDAVLLVLDRSDEPVVARVTDDRSDVGDGRRHTPLTTPVGVSEQQPCDSRLRHGGEKWAIGVSSCTPGLEPFKQR
jgi:hypothetical protein